MKRLTQLQHWKLCRFWNKHKTLHRACIVLVVAPVCLLCALPAAIKAAYEEITASLEWIVRLWAKSDHPYDKWINGEEED